MDLMDTNLELDFSWTFSRNMLCAAPWAYLSVEPSYGLIDKDIFANSERELPFLFGLAKSCRRLEVGYFTSRLKKSSTSANLALAF